MILALIVVSKFGKVMVDDIRIVMMMWQTELQNQDSVVYYIKPSLLSGEQNKLKWEHNIELFSEK